MKRFCLLLLLLCCCGCAAAIGASDYRDAAAIDLALATTVDAPAPSPGPTPDKCARCKGTGWITHGDGYKIPCPDCQGSAGAKVGGPIDTYRDAKALIDKGNALADRGKAILDQAQRDGKITVDVRLPAPPVSNPQTQPRTGGTCPGGVCPSPLPGSTPRTAINESATSCSDRTWRPRLLRWRR